MNHNYNKHNNNKRVAIDSIFLPPILFLSMVVLCLQKWIKNPIIRWNRNWEKFHFRLIWKIFFHSFIQTGRKTNGSLVWSRFYFSFHIFRAQNNLDHATATKKKFYSIIWRYKNRKIFEPLQYNNIWQRQNTLCVCQFSFNSRILNFLFYTHMTRQTWLSLRYWFSTGT